MRWEERARCSTYDPELFFAPRARAERRAKAVCAHCPVRDECLAFAIDTHVDYGVWGGTTVKERRLMRRGAGVPARELVSAIA